MGRNILAGISGTRLYPNTRGAGKKLLLVYDRPMKCYPLSILTLDDVRDKPNISTPQDLPRFQDIIEEADLAEWAF